MADPYTTLGVARGASEKEIKAAYRKLAKQLHPDYNKDNPKATTRFGEVTRAYDLLCDKDKRARFDRGEIDAEGNPAFAAGAGAQGFGGGGFGGAGGGFGGFGGQRGFRPEDLHGFAGAENAGLGDIFEGLFGGARGGGFPPGGGFGGRRAQPKGANVQYRLAVTLPDAARLAPQRITLADGKVIDLKLPAGVEDGTQMRLSGKGEAGPGGAAGRGDAIITIALQPHPFFTREGDNLWLDLPISLDEAVAGGKIKVPTAEGAVLLSVAPMSSSGRVLRLKGKGFTRKDGSRGDQLVTLHIVLPEAGGASAEELTRRLAGWRCGTDPRARLGV